MSTCAIPIASALAAAASSRTSFGASGSCCLSQRWPRLARATPCNRWPDEQVRENQQPTIIVTAQLAEQEAGLGSVVADIQGWMSEKGRLPPGYRWELGGHYIWQQQAFRSLAMVMVVAIMLVFIMLAIQ